MPPGACARRCFEGPQRPQTPHPIPAQLSAARTRWGGARQLRWMFIPGLTFSGAWNDPANDFQNDSGNDSWNGVQSVSGNETHTPWQSSTCRRSANSPPFPDPQRRHVRRRLGQPAFRRGPARNEGLPTHAASVRHAQAQLSPPLCENDARKWEDCRAGR